MAVTKRGRYMPYCKNCGNELPENAQFCPRCGTAVAKSVEPVVFSSPPQPYFAPGLKLAFWGERFVAWLIDVVIIGAVVGFISLITFLGGLSLSLIPG